MYENEVDIFEKKKTLQLFFVLYGSVVQGCFAGVKLMFRWYSGVFNLFSGGLRCSTTAPGFHILFWFSAVPPVFCVLLFRIPAFLVL